MLRNTQKWYLIPSLAFLVLTIISGTWLRLQWAWPQIDFPDVLQFRTDFLIHGHSHAALLGWVFLGLAGLILQAGTRHRRLPQTGVALLGGFVTILTILLFAAFVREGYAPMSIALSTIHMLTSYIFAWIFFRHARTDGNIASRYFLEGAVFWMVMATAGTWMLAAGRGMSPFWMDAAVQYYLHVLFNGWFFFALSGLAFRYFIAARYRRSVWPFWLMMAGLLPSLIPHLDITDPSRWVIFAGIAGTILYATGGMAIVLRVILTMTGNCKFAAHHKFSAREYRSLIKTGLFPYLLWPGLMGAVVVLLLPAAMAWPDFRTIWMQSDFLVIGFIHLQLLVVLSSFLLLGLLRVCSAKRPDPLQEQSDRPAIRFFRWLGRPVVPSVLFVAGSILMVAVLFTTGWHQVQGSLPFYPVQKTLFFTGLMTTSGAAWLSGVLTAGLLHQNK